MKKQQGWIKLHRKMLESSFHKKPTYGWLWVTLLMMANHKETKFLWNNEEQIVECGQILTGRKALSEQTGIAESTIEDILKLLENQHQIRQQKTSKFRLITIVKWDEFQSSDNTSNNKPTTNQQQTDTYNNEKNVDNDNKGDTPSQISKKFFNDINSEYREKYFNILIEKGFNEQIVKSEMLKFIAYWTEPDKSGKKQRWEKQPTFEIGRRLITWFSKYNKFNNKKTITSI